MRDEPASTDPLPRWLPYLLMGLAAVAAMLYAYTEAADLRRYAAGAFGMSLGAALLLWGREELLAGRIRGTRTYVRRGESPLTYFVLLAAKRLLPGSVMLVAGLWHAWTGPA